MMKWNTDRPLAVFDIESTGLNRKLDRIIDLAIVKLMPDGSREERVYRVNPEMPIPAGSSEIHGIFDDDVKDSPTFQEVAEDVVSFLEGADLGGFNLISYDIPMLEEEFKRVGVAFSCEGRRVVDAQRIFHKKEPRTLTAALRFYCDTEHTDAHGALADVDATIAVLEGQMQKYDDLPDSVEGLHEYCNPTDPNWLDRTGLLKWDADGNVLINFGQNRGRSLKEMMTTNINFLQWILKKDFPDDTKEILRLALSGTMPVRPEKP